MLVHRAKEHPQQREHVSSSDHLRMVHLELGDGRSANSGFANELQWTTGRPREMIVPCLGSRVEDGDSSLGFRVQGLDVGPLVPVASRARQSQIADYRLTAARFREDVVNWKNGGLSMRGEMAVFTAVPRAVHDIDSELLGDVAHFSGTKSGRSSPRSLSASCASSFSSVRFCQKSTSPINSSCCSSSRNSLFSPSSRRRRWMGSSSSYAANRRRAETQEPRARWNRGSVVERVAKLHPPLRVLFGHLARHGQLTGLDSLSQAGCGGRHE